MKLLLAGLLAASTFAVAAPAMAQGVYLGPGGVGVDTGVRPYGGYYRGGDDYYGHRPGYEGRSIYRDHRGDRFDRDRSDRGRFDRDRDDRD